MSYFDPDSGLGEFYKRYKRLGGCQQSEDQINEYKNFVKGMVPQTENNLGDFLPPNDELADRKLFRCHKILNALHSILKTKANAYRLIKYAQAQT